ncbi:MAG: stage II sporulation protein M [Candidatus Aenigmatarchaeota archaeon]
MVLERLISRRAALRNPLAMFMVGGIVSVACLVISFIVFSDQVGMFTTVLMTMAMTPFMVNLLYHEEKETENEIMRKMEGNFLMRHSDVLKVYAALFAGMVLALSITFLLLPEQHVQAIFEDQISEIMIIRGGFLSLDAFERIMLNNVGVLLISFLFSFLFGSGAIFILSWNASVLAAAIGLAAKSIGGVAGLPLAVLVFFPHGSLEILAYLVGGIAGGLVSVVLTRRHSKCFWRIIADSLKLLAVAAVLLVAAAALESVQM